ncbi:MAG: nucleotidyltransferase domain-containing protein [Candidatus Aenigmarchaeota archaeon]|nr:nucleotidyltransferase domain-containing protein [Candidatus Aenigmarchaeota archaeon]
MVMKQDVTAALKDSCKKILSKHSEKIKAIWIYGSFARGEAKPTSDIDVMTLIDDATTDVSNEELSKINSDISAISEAVKESTKINIHFQPAKRLTDWWDLLRSGEPWVFTSMRDALPVYDPSGYVEPLSRLLKEGRLVGTLERSQMLIHRAPSRLEDVRRIFLEDITADLLFAMVEAGQAVLMFYGIAPPSAKNLGSALRKHFVPDKILHVYYADVVDDFYTLTRKIDHGELTRLTAKEVDAWVTKARDFIYMMDAIFAKLEIEKKKEMVEESNTVAFTACKNVLKRKGVKFNDKNILHFVEKELVKTGLVSKGYLEILKKIKSMKRASDTDRLHEITEKDVYTSRLYAKNLETILKEVKK